MRHPSEILLLRVVLKLENNWANTQALTLYRPLTWTHMTANGNLLEITTVEFSHLCESVSMTVKIGSPSPHALGQLDQSLGLPPSRL